MRLGKTERYILKECFKRYPLPLRKFEVLEKYYGLKRSQYSIKYAYNQKVFFCSKETKRNSAAVRYSKAVGRLKRKGLVRIHPIRPNQDCIYLTGLGFETAERLTKFEATNRENAKNLMMVGGYNRCR